MACPRCGHDLETYSLQGSQASVCERCGYVGVSVDHKSKPLAIETWDDALERFRGQS